MTVAVLLVRAGLDEASKRSEPTPPTATAPTTTTPVSARRFYRIRAGDTLAVIAPRFGLTEAELRRAQPGHRADGSPHRPADTREIASAAVLRPAALLAAFLVALAAPALAAAPQVGGTAYLVENATTGDVVARKERPASASR